MVDAAKITLEEFGNNLAPNEEEVQDFISSHLPDYRSLYDKKLFAEICYVYNPRTVKVLYQVDPPEEANLNALGLNEEARRNAGSYYGFG